VWWDGSGGHWLEAERRVQWRVAEGRQFSTLCAGKRGWAVRLRDAKANS